MTTPLLKYAGGKTHLLPELTARMPEQFSRYYEPFCGGAAVFFALQPERAVISDVNADLIATYQAIRENPDAVMELVWRYRDRHNPEAYKRVRSWWNDRSNTNRWTRAAAFIYLNRTCYNGLWRVNAAGGFNVPIGRYTDPLANITERIRAAAKALVQAELRAGDYRDAIAGAQAGDFVYLDPPYDGTFTAYTGGGFSDIDQAELAYEVRKLADRGVRVMVSNADTPRIRALYAGLRLDVVRCPRAINSNGAKRGKVNEVIVTAGYEPAESRRAA